MLHYYSYRTVIKVSSIYCQSTMEHLKIELAPNKSLFSIYYHNDTA